jgi:hypothetical protein
MAKMPGAPAQQPVKAPDSDAVNSSLTSAYSSLSQMPGALAGMIKHSWMDKPQQDVPTAGEQILSGMNPANAVANNRPGDPRSGVDWGATGLNTIQQLAGAHALAPEVEGAADAARVRYGPPSANLIEGTYSKPGSQVAASLRGSTRFDVPAAASNAHPAIAEGLADRGITAADFKGRNGPAALQAGIDNAIDIHEARAKWAIDPIRGDVVDPQVLADNPELAQRLASKKNPTYGDIDAERIKMNKELRRANFYSKDPSAQYAVADPLANTEAAVNQARQLVYGKAQDVTGYDLRPLKQTESNLIKLGDLAETTKNGLSLGAAQTETASPLARGINAVKKVIAIKKNPASSLASLANSPETLDLNGFNSNMRGAFADVKPATASREVNFPRYNLNLTPPPPGAVGPNPPMQNILDFSKEAHPEPSPTRLPASSIRQKLLGAAPTEVPGPLRPAAGLSERRSIPRSMTMSQSDLEAAIKNRKPITTPFDDTIGARETMNRDINMPKPPGGGGRTGNSPGSISAEEANRPGTNYLVKRDGSLTAQSKSYAPEETKPGQAHVTLMSNGDYRVNAGDLTPQMEKGLRSGTKAKNRIY